MRRSLGIGVGIALLGLGVFVAVIVPMGEGIVRWLFAALAVVPGAIILLMTWLTW